MRCLLIMRVAPPVPSRRLFRSTEEEEGDGVVEVVGAGALLTEDRGNGSDGSEAAFGFFEGIFRKE